MVFPLLILFTSVFLEQAGAQDMGFMNLSADKTNISLEGQQIPGLDEQRASFSVPVWDFSESKLALTGRGQRMRLGEKLRFAKANAAIPEEFGSADFGFTWSHTDLSGNKLAVSASYGNAGTRLFAGDSEAVLSGMVVWERPKVDHSWMYFVAYSNNRTTLNNIPIPGFAYSMNRPTYTAVFGVPFIFVNWRPQPFSFSTTLSPFGVTFDSAIKVYGPAQIYASVGWLPKAYQNLVKGSDDRLIFDKKEFGTGARLNFGPMGSLSLGYVYGFDRRFMLGKSVTDSDAEKLEVKDSGGIQLKARASF